MRTTIFKFYFLLFTCFAFSQAGHVMQGVGAVNMSMGGAATAQPIDFNGAILWNPASLTAFKEKEISLSVGAFFSSPKLSSSLPAGILGAGAPGVKGTTLDKRGTSLMPALAMVWAKENSKHIFALSAFGISGFGVKFPKEENNPLLGANFDPTKNSNPINYPQQARGFGLVESDYMLLQMSLSYAYKFSDEFSIGVQPNIDYASLQLAPNPISPPSQTKGYPTTNKASAIGYGAQIGVFYDSGSMLKLGISYKTKQSFGKLEFKQKYLDGTDAPNVKYTMNYPAILSFGLGLSGKKIDFALDYRTVFYEKTEGFKEIGWNANASVKGFGWKNMTIISAGIQYQITEKMPIRLGYTYSSNAIKDELAFFSVSAPAVINNAAQIGLGYIFNNKWKLDAVFHQGFRGKGVAGKILDPMAINTTNPLGEMPNTNISYNMETSLIQFTLNYTFDK